MKNYRKAFTLVELVIVIAVIAVLAAVLIPTFGGVIKKANESVDTQTVKNINTNLSVLDNKPTSVGELKLVIDGAFGEGTFENLAPKSDAEGLHFWYDIQEGVVVLKSYEIILEEALGGVSLASFEDMEKDSIRLFANRYYLIDNKGASVGDMLYNLDNLSSKEEYEEVLNSTKFSNENQTLVEEIMDRIKGRIVFTNNGTFIYDATNINAITTLYFAPGIKNISSNLVALNGTINNYVIASATNFQGETAIKLPVTVEAVNEGAMFFDAEGAEIVMPAGVTLAQAARIFKVNSTNATIIASDGQAELDGESLGGEQLDYSNQVTSFDIAIKDPVANKMVLAYNNTQGCYELYVAVDHGNSIQLNITNIISELGLSDSEKEKVINEATWSVDNSKITCTNAGVLTINGYENNNTAKAGVVTLKVQHITKEIHVYGVKAINVKVDTSDNAGLDIKDISQTQVLITLPYNPTIDNTFNFKPSLVINYPGTGIVLDGNITVTAGAMAYSNGKLTLPKNTYTDNAVTQLSVSFNGATSDITYTVNLINNADKSFEVNDEHVTTETYSTLEKYYVGKSGTFKLSYLFKEIKNITGQTTVVEIWQGATKIGSNEYATDGLASELNLSSLTCLNQDITIKIGVKGSAAREEVTVYFVDATNVTADTVSSMPSGSAKDIVLLSDIELNAEKSLRYVYGNLHKISSSYTISTRTNWIALIKLYGIMQDTLVIGPTYHKIDFHDGLSNKAYTCDGVQMASANSSIVDSYLYGFRAPVAVNAGRDSAVVEIKNTTIEGGAFANIIVASVKELKLTNVTTVQDNSGYTSTTGSGKVYGLCVYFDSYSKGKVTIDSETKFYNWINNTIGEKFTTKIYSSYTIKDVIKEMVGLATNNGYLHSDGYVNTGFVEEYSTSDGAGADEVAGQNFSGVGKIKFGTTILGYFIGKEYNAWSIPACDGTCSHDFLPVGWSHQNTHHADAYLNGRKK